MSSIRLLQASDLHIAKYPSLPQLQRRSPGNYLNTILKGIYTILKGTYAASHSPGMLRALVTLADSQKGSLDAIVLTGDIATTGLDHDLLEALHFVDGPPDARDFLSSGGGPTISGLGLNVFLLPGNHDRYKQLLKRAGYLPGGRNFHKVFAKYWGSDVARYAVVKGNLAVGVLAADFSLRRWSDSTFFQPINWYAQGKTYRDILSTLESETALFQQEYSDKDVCVIWAVHFPPVFKHTESHMRLIDDHLLIDSANKSGVHLIISGHTHNPFEFSSPRTEFRVLGAGTATQDHSPEGNYCQVISIENDETGLIFDIDHYKFDPNTCTFVRV
jgi:3',5'-cyclic AMP phosphodiesterase CpdA